MEGKLNIFSIYRFMLSVLIILKWLTSLWYVVHVYSGSSHLLFFIHCILCFMWLGFSPLFSYKGMYAGGVNFTSLFFMNVYRIYIFLLFDLFSPPLLMNDKKREKYLMIYICFISFSCFITKRRRRFLGRRIFALCMFISLFMHIYLFSLMHFIEYLIVYWYAWVKGELLWSLSLIHAYITPWVLSSSKRGRLLARRPIALVLMMINSYSYSTNDLVFN